jgi:hypothetical protein
MLKLSGDKLDPGRPQASPLQASVDGRAHDRLAPELPAPVHPLGEIDRDVSRLCESDLCPSPHEKGLGIASR